LPWEPLKERARLQQEAASGSTKRKSLRRFHPPQIAKETMTARCGRAAERVNGLDKLLAKYEIGGAWR
jgi:hypothetical protein